MFLALRDLRRGLRRFVLLGVVIALVAVLSTVLSGLATGLVTDGISGLRALPADRYAFQGGAEATFSRSTLRQDAVDAFAALDGVDATPVGVTFVNGSSTDGGPSIDIVLFGVEPDGFLLDDDVRAALAGDASGMVVDDALQDEGVRVGDRFAMGGSDLELSVVAFASNGSYGHAPIAFVPLETWQRAQYGSGAEGRFSAVALRGGSGGELDRAAQPLDLDVLTKTQAYDGSPGFTAQQTTMTMIRGFLLVISALVIGAFFTVLTVQRTRQIGLLKATGASNAYILRDSIGQMTVLVTVATAVGVAAGAGIVVALSNTEAPVELDLRSVLFVGVLLVVSGVIGSLVALRRITQVEPAIALGVEP